MKCSLRLLAFTLLLGATPALAGDTCPKSYANVQFAKRDRKLSLAREEARACISQCSNTFRKECEEWLAEVEQAMPSIVISARTTEGKDVTDVVTSMDGKIIASKADGSPLEIDPGEHHLSFAHKGLAPIEQTLVIRAGEKNRNVPVTILADTAKVTTPSPPVAPGTPKEAEPSRAADVPARNWTLPLIAGGIGAAGFITAGILGAGVASSISECEATPTKRCATQEEWDSLDQRKTLTNIAFGVGVAGLVGAGILYFATTPSSAGSKTARLSPQFFASPYGAALHLQGRF